MIKTATIYKMTQPGVRALRDADHANFAVSEPGKTQWSRMGLTPFFNSEYRYDVTGGFLLTVRIKDRVLPGKVIKTSLDAKVAEVTERQGTPVNSKQRMELKDVIVDNLLSTAFIKDTDIPVCVISSSLGHWLVIGTGSASKVDDILALLRETTDKTLNLEPFGKGLDLDRFLRSVMDSDLFKGDDSMMFSRGLSAVLKGTSTATVRYKGVELEELGNDIKHNFVPTEVRIEYGSQPTDDSLAEVRLTFTLTNKGVFRSIRFSDVAMEDVEESARGEDNHAAYFDGTAALFIGEMRQMLKELRELAGEAVEDDEL